MNGSSASYGTADDVAATPTLRCALIGADTLLVECAQVLLDRGHVIIAIAAGSDRVAAWAEQRGIPVLDAMAPDALWAEGLREQGVDHLFAITHLHPLPPSVIAVPRGLAVNFHDGPLPEYAGLNTPVWGLLHDVPEWGITWHRLSDTLDAGDIVVQHRFAVAPRETSLSLNTRNFEQALDGFGELLDQLEAGTVAPTPQGGGQTAMYRRRQRPVALLDWSQSAEQVDRVVRALHFGPHPNPVAAATIYHPLSPVLVGSSDIDRAQWVAAPGTVVAADEQAVTVACGSDAVRLSGLTSVDGAPLSPSAFLSLTGLTVGSVLAAPPPALQAAVQAHAQLVQPQEAALLATLSALAAIEFPWPHGTPQGVRTSVAVPAGGGATAVSLVAALSVLAHRLGRGEQRHVALALPPAPAELAPLTCASWPLDLAEIIDDVADGVTGPTAAALQAAVATALATTGAHDPWLRDAVARTPSLAGSAHLAGGLQLPLGVRLQPDHAALGASLVVLQPNSTQTGWELVHDVDAVTAADAQRFADVLAAVATALQQPDALVDAIPLVDDATFDTLVRRWNDTAQPVEPACIHDLIIAQVAATPDRIAVADRHGEASYAQLQTRAAELASVLRGHGVGPDVLVGVHVERGIDLLVAVLGVLLAGGAYVPLDPAYPADRLRHMLADSGAPVVVCQQRHAGALPLPPGAATPTIVFVDALAPRGHDVPAASIEPHHLAYCIYTSGSTGLPKGVLVEHRNVANFFAAMDAVVPRGVRGDGCDTWFAVTSLSFDISVLELLYTLSRGMRVVLHEPSTAASAASPTTRRSTRPMDFSLFYFSGDEAEDAHTGKYRLLLEGAKFADQHGFCAVWTPERHFHAFGGLYPNPAITGAAVAAVTERVAIRAGSVVLPLHHPAEIAEAWSVVDNLSNGRVGVAFASGWQPNDFIFRPQNYHAAKQVMFDSIEQVQRLWQGETLTFEGPEGMAVDVTTLPRPVQPTLPVWVTTAGNPETFAQAGTAGANLLTHLLGQSVDQLAPKLAAYRAARAAAGHDPATGIVTLMLHTFVGTDDDEVRATVREPLRNYLRTSFNLVKEYAWSFPAFQRPDGTRIEHVAELADDDVANLSPDELDAVLEYAFHRYYDTSGMFGTPQRLAPFVEQLHQVGVDEVACLLDFGVGTDAVLAGLPHLAQVLQQAQSVVAAVGDEPRTTATYTTTNTAIEHDQGSLGEQLLAADATHLQCTPSMARMLVADPVAHRALRGVVHTFVGGEALPPALADELRLATDGTVTNMYGPTETTIWSSTWQLQPGWNWVPIGTPIANTQLYVLDGDRRPVPPGVTGDLWVGGNGVVRGYHGRPELTAARFAPDPFRGAPHRMYFTGDLARWRTGDNDNNDNDNGEGHPLMEFLGRSDQQVKLRGYRIELGEIEARMRRLPDVADCVAIVREDSPGDQQLIAYVVATEHARIDPFAIRDALRAQLPEAMVPAHVVELRALPHTPNGKLDRNALPQPTTVRAHTAVAPANELERTIVAAWCTVLGVETVGVDDNFFDVGGHSLLVVRLHRTLLERLEQTFALTDLYRFPTVRAFAASLTAPIDSEPAAISAAVDRAARRRANLRGRS